MTFTVRRKQAVLVRPAKATPRETKHLSDLDEQAHLHGHVPTIFFYRGGGKADDGRDPVAVIRRALGEALVSYYPLAGRLREVEGRKLVVDCTGEGVLFVEADADVRLADLEAAGLRPPFPCIEQLLFDVEGFFDFNGVLNWPLLLIQVTRLLCGGFVLALYHNHAMLDAIGEAQFLSAVAELACGRPSPTISPAWSRELLRLRACHPPEPAAAPTIQPPSSSQDMDMVMRTFTFGSPDIAAIKMLLSPRLRNTATTFEALTAALWRARTAALELPPDEKVSLFFACNLRGVPELGLPAGYYGNAVIILSVVITSGELLCHPLDYAVEKMHEAKASVSAEFLQSTTDPLMLRGRAELGIFRAFRVSDIRRVGFHLVDFGWGVPVYSGRADSQPAVSFLVAIKNACGMDVLDVPLLLPRAAMDRFASEVEMLLTPPPQIAQQASTVPQARL